MGQRGRFQADKISPQIHGSKKDNNRLVAFAGTARSVVLPSGQRTVIFPGGLPSGQPKKQAGLDWLK
jgi:hypothetical protein